VPSPLRRRACRTSPSSPAPRHPISGSSGRLAEPARLRRWPSQRSELTSGQRASPAARRHATRQMGRRERGPAARQFYEADSIHLVESRCSPVTNILQQRVNSDAPLPTGILYEKISPGLQRGTLNQSLEHLSF